MTAIHPAEAEPASAHNNSAPEPAPLSEQVSFIITHHVLPGHHGDYEAWLKKTIALAAQQKGHMGAHVMTPTQNGDKYEIAVRFATREDAESWINSPTRKDLIREVEPYISKPETLNIKSGIDYWFTTVTEGNRPPKRWKQWMTTVSVIWPLTMILPVVLAPLFENIPLVGVYGVRHLISAMCTVGLLVYVIMPGYTKAIAKWLSR